MDRIRRLQGTVRNYAWGSRTALAELRGRPSPSAEPEAELWMGAHPSAPSRVDAAVPNTPNAEGPALDDWIARDPAAALGAETAERFGGELPFLFKVLAPERALSIQTHPDAQRARAGFDRENAAGLALSDPRRSYRDPNPKPELICALTRFEALCAFRDAAQIRASLERLEIAALEPTLTALRSGGLAAGFRTLLESSRTKQREIAETARAEAAKHGSENELALVVRLANEHPGDIGILAPLWMRHVTLEPGQALFLEAGEIHAYLRGVGLEVLGNSDNVLRGGLTSKHIDVPELLETLSFSDREPEILTPMEADDPSEGASYPARADAFSLRVYDLTAEHPIARTATAGSAEIWLCSEGRARLVDDRHATTVELARGEAAWVPASVGPHTIEGAGRLHVAGVGATR